MAFWCSSKCRFGRTPSPFGGCQLNSRLCLDIPILPLGIRPIRSACRFQASSSFRGLGFVGDCVWVDRRLALSRSTRHQCLCCGFPACHCCHLVSGFQGRWIKSCIVRRRRFRCTASLNFNCPAETRLTRLPRIFPRWSKLPQLRPLGIQGECHTQSQPLSFFTTYRPFSALQAVLHHTR